MAIAFVADTIDFLEIAMKEPLPLATIQRAVIDFLRGRDDVVLFGAQAVNVYVREPRATEDVDVLSTRASQFAEELRTHLASRFHIAARVRDVKNGAGYRVFQVQKTGNRHLVDIRSVATCPSVERLDGVQVLSPPDLVASKVVAYFKRRGKPKSGTDWRDLALLLLAFPDLKSESGPVSALLAATDVESGVIGVWRDLVAQPVVADEEDDDF
jgi:hypothetical protein